MSPTGFLRHVTKLLTIWKPYTTNRYRRVKESETIGAPGNQVNCAGQIY